MVSHNVETAPEQVVDFVGMTYCWIWGYQHVEISEENVAIDNVVMSN